MRGRCQRSAPGPFRYQFLRSSVSRRTVTPPSPSLGREEAPRLSAATPAPPCRPQPGEDTQSLKRERATLAPALCRTPSLNLRLPHQEVSDGDSASSPSEAGRQADMCGVRWAQGSLALVARANSSIWLLLPLQKGGCTVSAWSISVKP